MGLTNHVFDHETRKSRLFPCYRLKINDFLSSYSQNLKIDIFTLLHQIPCYTKSRLGTLRLISWWRVTNISELQLCYYGLRPSSSIMGVHPGSPVCKTVAASLVAVDIHVGETISNAKVAFVCGLWSVGVVALRSAGPFSYFCVYQLLFPTLQALVQSPSPPPVSMYQEVWSAIIC